MTIAQTFHKVRSNLIKKMITPAEISKLLKNIQKFITDDNRASDDPEDTTPGIQITVATTTGESWDYQTGDNSYSGGAYCHPHWSVQSIYKDTDCDALAETIVDELLGMVEEAARLEAENLNVFEAPEKYVPSQDSLEYHESFI